MGLSKEERKQLRRQAEQSIHQADEFCWVISPKATPVLASPSTIVARARTFAANLCHIPVGEDSHAIHIPGEPQLCVVMGFATLDEDLYRLLKDYEWLVREPGIVRVGMPVIAYRGKVRQDTAIQLVAEATKRALGPLVGGVWASSDDRVLMDDWLAWSGDYLDPDIFNYRPEFAVLPTRFPSLRCDRRPGGSR